MKLAQVLRDEILKSRRDVTAAVGPILVTMLDGMGLCIVPSHLVDAFHRMLERSDAKAESEPCMSAATATNEKGKET